MVFLVRLTMNAQPACSTAMMRRWEARLAGRNRMLAKKNRSTLTMAAHHSQLQTRLMKRIATMIMFAKCPPNPRKSVKRKIDSFDETRDDPGSLSEPGRWYHKKRRVKSPQTVLILEKFGTDPYGLPYQREEVVEITDCPVFAWWYSVQPFGLWPILPASSYPPEIEAEFFFSFPPKRKCTPIQDIHVAEDTCGEKDCEIAHHNLAIAQENTQEMLDSICMSDFEAGEGPMNTDEGWIADACPIEYSPEELRFIVGYCSGCAVLPCEYCPDQPWIVQADIANITSDRMEAKASPTIQQPPTGLECDSNEQKRIPGLSATIGPIRTSSHRGRKGSRSSLYDKSLRGSLTFKTKQSADKIVESPEIPLESSGISFVPSQESRTNHKTGADIVTLPHSEPVKPTSPYSHQVKVVDTDALPPSVPVEPASSCSHQNNVADIDDSGYVSDDGLDQAFADAAEEIDKEKAESEKDQQMHPWKPRVSSPLKNEIHPEDEISSKTFPAMPKSTRRNQPPLGPKERQEIRDNISLIFHLTTRDLNEEGKRLHPKHCGQGDHRDRSNCRRRPTAVARGILRIGDGHLTPERVRKAAHQQLRLIARLEEYGATEKDLASNATKNACETLEQLDYVVSYFGRSMPGLADLENHVQEICQMYEVEHGKEMSRVCGVKTEEEQQKREKRQLTLNKGHFAPLVRRITRATHKDQS